MEKLTLLLVAAAAALCVQAGPLEQPLPRNTIFADEKLEGQVFEDTDKFSSAQLTSSSADAYRLPTTTRPIHYDVLWTINIQRLAYDGTVAIQLAATQPGVHEIVIHSSHVTVLSVSLTQAGVEVPQTYRLDPDFHFLRVRPVADLEYDAATPVVYTLTVQFGAEMRTDMYGIYGSWYRNNANDEPIWMATTQFQATAARYAFPCYDEPSFKATFDVTIRRPTGYRSWFCTRRRTLATVETGYEDDIYHTTPVMSTYLLALIVADYDSIEEVTNDLLTYEVIARPGAISQGQGQYAFDVGQQLLARMSQHTALDYYEVHPTIKMTQAAIPDFGAGAMENWGLLTYREAYVLYDENHTSSYFKQLIAYILSHEIAHMWFGNLVTCDWWDELWLNEGFARYYQYFLTHWVEDYMGLETRFISEQVHTSLLSDSANSPQPLNNPGVGSPASVSAMFSTISYNKGAAIIRMTEHLMGSTIHEEGLRRYLEQNKFKTTHPIDLYSALESAGQQLGAFDAYGSDFNFVEYYKSWTDQPGHPVLNVHVDHATGNMTITQRRFNINTGYSSISTNYIVPLSFATASDPSFASTKPTHVLRDTAAVISRGSVGDQWVVFNKQQTGYYRVNYDDYTWDLIALALRGSDRTLIHEYNRAQIVNDIFQFARAGLMTYTRALDLLSFLQYETAYAPWVTALTGFSWLRARFEGTEHITQLNALVTSWASLVMSQLTYYPLTGEDFMQSYLRWQLAPVMCALEVSACRAAATAQFQALRDQGTEVPVDSRNWVYCNALRDGTEADFTFLWNRFQTHNVYTEKITLLQTLGCSPHANSLNTFLAAIVQDNYLVRPQDYTTALSSAATGNEVNTNIVLAYMQQNLAAVTAAFGDAATPLSYVTTRLRTEQDIIAFQNWAMQNQEALGGSYQAVYEAAESSRASLQWAAANAADVTNYLANGGAALATTSAPVVSTAEPTTVTPAPLVQPSTPALDTDDVSTDAAATSLLSALLLTTAVAVNFVF